MSPDRTNADRNSAERTNAPLVRIEPWTDSDLGLLRRINAPEMMEHLGGPETEEQILTRHRRYADVGGSGIGRMFSVVLLPELEAVGNVGYWERVWRGEAVYEIGWAVLPPFQGRGIARAAAAAAVARARAEGKHRHLHAYPSVDNPASNAVCRKLGFVLISACDFEYPPGSVMRCNNWRLDLEDSGAAVDGGQSG
jgi:RimJ/RimL family protein N-acetyltransferase